ncbi:MAG TPA: signal peptidase I [Gemmatimonadales bacterium]|jgi:signal peptidase I|nr:signal peptidase I [Gemmatimonadales bacterium]
MTAPKGTPPKAPAQPKTLGEEIKSWARSIAIALVCWVVIRSYLIEAFRIPSASMEPTLLVGDWLFVNKTIYGGALEIPIIGTRWLRIPGYAQPHRDGLIIFRSVEDSTPHLIIVKRVIGEPGDTLQMTHDTVYRNGRALVEPYALHLNPGADADIYRMQMRRNELPHYIGKTPEKYNPTSHDWGPLVVPRDSFWVMGDNRDDSYDSRFWGFLPRAHIEGKPELTYFSIGLSPLRIRWNRFFRHPT